MNNVESLWPLAIFLALVMGFAADRTNLCSVHAVKEVLFERHASIMMSFAKIVLWVLGTSLLLEWLFAVAVPAPSNFQFGLHGHIGGLLFGVGAVLNDGCSLHTLTRLGRGNLGMVVSILGLMLGAIACRKLFLLLPELAPVATQAIVSIKPLYRDILSIALLVWMAIELFKLLRDFRPSQCHHRFVAPRYRLSSGAALVGVTNGILFTMTGIWMYTYTLIQGTTNLAFPGTELYKPIPTLLWWLLSAYLGGIVASSFFRHGMNLDMHPRRSWYRYFSGGALMGLGASLVPGGNDVLLLNAIPGLTSHALPAYGSMLAGVVIALWTKMRFFTDE